MFPYYYIPDFWGWFESLAYIFVGVAIFALLFLFTRDIPWLVVLPTVFGVVAGGMAAISYVYPEMFQMVVSLSGYFVKTKLYTTIAEAQAPDFSRMIFSYGVVTTYLAIVGVGWAAWKLPSEKWRNDYIVTIIWAGMAIYMAMSAVRFMYNATPVFAIMSAWITYEIIQMTDFGTMWRNYSNLRRGQRWYAFKESVKPRHVLITVFVVGLIVLPNTTSRYTVSMTRCSRPSSAG
jgi:dolichyl-diphosphooligosaccharide--protein glycosyltransferase